jgi:tRNA (guanine37-N1)-methyltransferase
MFDGFLNESIIKRALDKNLVEINIHNLRDFSKDVHKRVDDYPYGGGQGMVLMIEPVYDAIKEYKDDDSTVILMTPQGTVFKQKIAYDLSLKKHLIIVCGHYEGFDERIRSLVDMEISIGDFVLTGGEIPSMVITDSIVRLIDGVIEKESHQNDSFNNNLLDYPVYTKPRSFMGMDVPEVLLSGHHKNILEYRLNEQIKRTKERRPDLIEKM